MMLTGWAFLSSLSLTLFALGGGSAPKAPPPPPAPPTPVDPAVQAAQAQALQTMRMRRGRGASVLAGNTTYDQVSPVMMEER